MENSNNIQLLLSKLRQPLSLEFISSHILEMEISETKLYLNTLIEEGLILEKEKNFYVIKTN